MANLAFRLTPIEDKEMIKSISGRAHDENDVLDAIYTACSLSVDEYESELLRMHKEMQRLLKPRLSEDPSIIIIGECETDEDCPDHCDGSNLKTNGQCENGKCEYDIVVCELKGITNNPAGYFSTCKSCGHCYTDVGGPQCGQGPVYNPASCHTELTCDTFAGECHWTITEPPQGPWCDYPDNVRPPWWFCLLPFAPPWFGLPGDIL